MSRSSNGIIVLVDHARPERLRDLVLELLPDHPDLFVTPKVEDIVRMPEGAVLVLVPGATDADFLNLNRPVFSRLRLKVVLWCDVDTTAALARDAVDFFDWISHRHECPPGVARHGVFGLRAAAKAHARCIWWTGGDLAETFRLAFPNEQPPLVLDARRRFSLLVRGVRYADKHGRWIVWRNVAPEYRAEVVALVLAETQRKDRMIIDARNTPSYVGFPVLHGDCWSLPKAVNHLGHRGSVRLAALTGLEPETITLLYMLFSELGAEENLVKQLEEVLRSSEDPGAALAGWAMDRAPRDELLAMLADGLDDNVNLIAWVESGRCWTTPFLRALAEKNQFPATWHQGLSDYAGEKISSIGTALRCAYDAHEERAKDAEVLARRAVDLAAQVLGEDSIPYVESSYVLGKVLMRRGELRAAEELFCRGLGITNARQISFPNVHERMLLRLSRALADVLTRQGRYEEAEEQAQRAVEIATGLGNPELVRRAWQRRRKIRALR